MRRGVLIACLLAAGCTHEDYDAGAKRVSSFRVELATNTPAGTPEEPLLFPSAIPAEVTAPSMLNLVHGGNTPVLGQSELAEAGYAVVLYANAALQASIAGMQRVLGHIQRTGSIDGMLDEVATFDERQRLVGKPHFDQLGERYTTD